MKKVNLAEKLSLIDALWSPRIVGQLNGQQVKLARVQGEFDWHHHEHEDELFLVLRGRLVMRLEGEEVTLEAGELCIVPRGTRHQPVATEEAHILLFEPAGTLNTGDVKSERTIDAPDWI